MKERIYALERACGDCIPRGALRPALSHCFNAFGKSKSLGLCPKL